MWAPCFSTYYAVKGTFIGILAKKSRKKICGRYYLWAIKIEMLIFMNSKISKDTIFSHRNLSVLRNFELA